MSFMPDTGGRYRRRRSETRRRWIMTVIVVGSLCIFSYWRGAENARSAATADNHRAIKLDSERKGLEDIITNLRSEVQSLQVRYQQLDERYKAEVPSGELAKLTDLIRRQLTTGIKSERILFAIESARPPKNCSTPITKKFVVKTPAYSGPNVGASFWNGSVQVTGIGQSAVNASSQAEAWYDPGKPVVLTFIQVGGKETVKEGLLPIQHSIVIADKEYRFTVAVGERSFISVVSDSCDYP